MGVIGVVGVSIWPCCSNLSCSVAFSCFLSIILFLKQHFCFFFNNSFNRLDCDLFFICILRDRWDVVVKRCHVTRLTSRDIWRASLDRGIELVELEEGDCLGGLFSACIG